MDKIKKIFAWVGIVILVGMYGSTLVFALIGSDRAIQLLMASFIATLVVPVLLYVVIRAPFLVTKDPYVAKKKDTKEETEQKDEE